MTVKRIKPRIKEIYHGNEFEKTGEGTYLLDVCGICLPASADLYRRNPYEKMSEGDVVEVIFDNPSSRKQSFRW